MQTQLYSDAAPSWAMLRAAPHGPGRPAPGGPAGLGADGPAVPPPCDFGTGPLQCGLASLLTFPPSPIPPWAPALPASLSESPRISLFFSSPLSPHPSRWHHKQPGAFSSVSTVPTCWQSFTGRFFCLQVWGCRALTEPEAGKCDLASPDSVHPEPLQHPKRCRNQGTERLQTCFYARRDRKY